MYAAGDLTGLALVMGAALALGLGMRRIGQPPIVGYILAGVLLGPSVLGLVGNREAVTFLAELGVLLLLFLVAMEMSLYAFREVWKVSAAATVLQLALGVGIMLPLVWLIGMSWGEAAVLGFVMALSSTAVVIKMLEQTNILRQPVGRLVVGVLIAQDLAVVPLLIAVTLLSPGEFNPWMALKFAAAVAVVAALVYFLARRKRLVLPLSNEGTPGELVALAGLALCFGGAALTGFAGLTPALGAFLAGLVIGNSTARHPMIVSTRPIQGVLMMVFFLSVGLLIDFKFLAERWDALILLLLAVTLLKTVLNIGILAVLREPWPHAFIAGVLLAQIGEFSLVIAGAAERGGIISRELGQTIVAVVAFSLLISPLWLFTTRRLLRVVLLNLTSLQDTLDALKNRRLAAATRAVLRGLVWCIAAVAAALAFVARMIGALFRKRAPRAGDDAAAAAGDTSHRRRRPGDTLMPESPRGVVEPPEAPETPRFPPPDGSPLPSPPAPLTPPLPLRARTGEPPTIPRREAPLAAFSRPPAGPDPETPRFPAPGAPPPEGPAPASPDEPPTLPRPDGPSAALRGPRSGPNPETPRYPPPDGPPPERKPE